jgi:hypothetical protein
MTNETSPTQIPSPARPVSSALVAAAAASAGAGLVHAAAAGTHNGDATLAWVFAATAVAQIAWAAFAVLRPHRLLIAAGVALNGGAALAWVLSRTVGLAGPLVEVEAVGVQDLLAAVLGTIAAVGASAALTRRGALMRANVAAAGLTGVLVLALAMPAMAADHTHGPSHDHAHDQGESTAMHEDPDGNAHEHGDGNAHEHGDGHAPDGHSQSTAADAAAGPVITVDDPRLTKAERSRAVALIDETRAALEAFPDESAIVAAGYVSIGDGRQPGKFEHFVNRTYLMDDRELDAEAIESIVVQVQADGTKTVMSAMYILSPGSTMEDVPNVAGELSIWHDHQNLCWDPTGTRLAGILVNGECRPAGVLRATSPMLHVWLEDTPCGPFSGIEGHGGSCEHGH